MQLPEICIRQPVLASMMSLAIILFGVIGLTRLPVRELPDVDPPVVNVLTVYPGASAEVVETEVTEKLEEAINTTEGIKHITSKSGDQTSSITVEFDLSRPIEEAAQDVRDRVSRVRGDLPDEVDEPVISKQDGDAAPFLWLALYSERLTTQELTEFAERNLKDSLQTVSGVSTLIFGGEKRYAVRFVLDSEKMAAHGVTVLDVDDALKKQNLELPSGRVENRQREMTIQTKGEMKTLDEFNRLVIREESNGQQVIRLLDIGQAVSGVEDERSIARYNGKPALGMGIIKQAKANTIDVAKGVKAEMESLKKILPAGVEYYIAYDESVFVEKSINEVWDTLAIAFGLVILVILVFLRNLRSTLIPAISIPVSIIGTFALLYFIGYSVNTLTMLALVLAIGVVVDDSIVVLENIFRHIEEGMTPFDASIKGMQEITFAIIATTVTLAAVFLPLAFQTSITGRLFVEFAVALAGSVIISAFVSLTLTPALAARLLKPMKFAGTDADAAGGHHAPVKARGLAGFFERRIEAMARLYERLLRWSLRHRGFIVFIAIASVAVSFLFARTLDSEFIPEEDKGQLFSIAIAPVGSTSEYTDKMVKSMEGVMGQVPEAAGYFSAVALPFNGPGDPAQGVMFARFKEDRKRPLRDIVGGPAGIGAKFFLGIEGAICIPIMPKAINTGGFSQPFQLVLQSQDLAALNATTQDITNKLRGAGVFNPASVRPNFELTKPELRITINRDRAAALNVSVEDISRTMQILFGGLDLSKVKRDGKEYDIIVQLGRASRLTPADVTRLYLRNTRGELVQFSNVVDTTEGAGPNSIFHYDRLRSATIEATPVGVPLGVAVSKASAILATDLPPGFRQTWSGDAENLRETGGELIFVVIIALLIVYMVLASQFESLVHPVTVMLAIPLAGLGAFGALWAMSWVDHAGNMFFGWANYAPNPPAIAHTLANIIPRLPAMNLNLFSLVGFVILVALVTKNSILLVEFANQRMAAGKDALEAMIESGLVRFRPIVMTSLSTIFGILPIAIGLGAGAESRRPLGVVAVGGLITSTILTLFVVPVVYVLFDKWFGSRKKSAK